MRLTADLAQHCAQRINPLRERELDLRGYKLGQIENLGVLRDQARAARPPPPTAPPRRDGAPLLSALNLTTARPARALALARARSLTRSTSRTTRSRSSATCRARRA